MMKLSFAQNFEDIILARLFTDLKNGFYIDVGAQHPLEGSVSYYFYLQGWRGINIEPSPKYALLLAEYRPDEMLIQDALGESPGSLEFFDFENTGLSTVVKSIAEERIAEGLTCVKRKVNVHTLDDVFAKAPETVHWLKIDVEGFEAEVLSGWRTDTRRPWIVVFEANPGTDISRCEGLLLAKGYELVFNDGLNLYFLHIEKINLRYCFEYSVGMKDEFCISPFSKNPLNAYMTYLLQQSKNEVEALRLSIEQFRTDKKYMEYEKIIRKLRREVIGHRKMASSPSKAIKEEKFDYIFQMVRRLIRRFKRALLK